MNKAVLRIPVDDMLRMIAPRDEWPSFTLKPNTLPAGAAILDVHANYEHRTIDYVVQHESFPQCAKGSRLFVIMGEVVETPAPIVTDAGRRKG